MFTTRYFAVNQRVEKFRCLKKLPNSKIYEENEMLFPSDELSLLIFFLL